MAHTLWSEEDRRALEARLARLRPDAKALWGSFDAPRMVCHITDTVRSATGDLPCTPKPSPLGYPIIKSLVMFYLPWPKGAPTAPELISREPDPTICDGRWKAYRRRTTCGLQHKAPS